MNTINTYKYTIHEQNVMSVYFIFFVLCIVYRNTNSDIWKGL